VTRACKKKKKKEKEKERRFDESSI